MQFLREKPVDKERQNPESAPNQTENSAQQISGIQNIRPLDYMTDRDGGRQQQKLLLGFGLSAEIQKRKRPNPRRQAKIPTAGGKHIGGKADAEHRPCRFFQWFTLVHCKSSLSLIYSPWGIMILLRESAIYSISSIVLSGLRDILMVPLARSSSKSIAFNT